MTSFSGGGRVMRNRISEPPTVGRQVLPNAPGIVAPRTVSSSVLTQLDQFLGAINSVDRLANSAANYANTVDSINRRTAAEAQAAQDQIRRDAERSQKEMEAAQTFDRGIAKESADLNAPRLTDLVSNGKIGRLQGETDQQFVARVTDPFVPADASASYRQKFVDELGPKIMAAEIGFQKEARSRAESDIIVAGSNAAYASQSPEEINAAIKAVEQSAGPMAMTKQADLILKPALERAAARGDEKTFNLLSTAYLQRNGDATKVEAEAAKLRATQENIKTQDSSRVRDMLDRELARLPLDLAEVQFNANKDKLTGSDELIIKGKLDTMRREVQQQQQKAEEQTIRTNVSSRIDALLSTPFGDPAKGIPPAALASVPPEIKVPTSNGGVVSISTNELVQANLNRRFAEIDASPGTPDDKIRLKADLVASNPVKYDGWSRIAAGANNLALDQTTGKASPAFVEAAKLYGDVSPHYAGLLDKYFPDNGTAKRAVAATVAAARARTLNPGDPPDYAEAARDVLLRVPNWKAFSNLTFQQKRPDEYFDKQIKSIASGGDKSVKNRGDVANEVRTLTEFYAAAGNMTEKDALAEAIKQVSASHINVNGWAVNSQGNLPTSGQNTLTVRQLEFLLQKASEQYHAANKDLLPGFGVEDITFRPGPRDGTWIPAYGNTGMIAPNAQGWIITNKALLEVLGESASNAKSVNADLDRMFGKSRTLPRAPSYFVGGPGGIPGDAKLPGLGSIFGTSE